MDTLPEWIKVLGGAAGIAALVWRFIDEFGTYLRIQVEIEAPKSGWCTVLTTVENKSNRAKHLSYAFLLIAPEAENPLDSAKALAVAIRYGGPVRFTNDFELLRAGTPTYDDGRALIPLPFYYLENVNIVDEALTYRAPVDVKQLRDQIPYAVRFYIFGRGRLHRSTHESFINSHA